MESEERDLEKKLSLSELRAEELDHELSVAERKARLKELKRGGWGDKAGEVVKWIKSMKVDKETARGLYRDFSGLRDLSDPRHGRR